MPFRVETHGKRTLIYMRCLVCGLEWTAEREPFVPPRKRS